MNLVSRSDVNGLFLLRILYKALNHALEIAKMENFVSDNLD